MVKSEKFSSGQGNSDALAGKNSVHAIPPRAKTAPCIHLRQTLEQYSSSGLPHTLARMKWKQKKRKVSPSHSPLANISPSWHKDHIRPPRGTSTMEPPDTLPHTHTHTRANALPRRLSPVFPLLSRFFFSRIFRRSPHARKNGSRE